MKRLVLSVTILWILPALVGTVSAADEQETGLLSVDRIYQDRDFATKGFSPRWYGESSAYTKLEASDGPVGGQDILLEDAATERSEVLVPASLLVPGLEGKPLEVEGYSWSKNGARLLIYTNSKRVWRRKTRGDYWVLDRTSRELRQLGGDAPPATMQFAKFSPDGRRVAYVRENDIYVEDLEERTIQRLTKDGSERIINGTFDWVYEEELGLRDGLRWSPDGESIAYWQLDTKGVREFPLVNLIDALYPRIRRFKYPKVGEKNPAARLGVVSLQHGKTRWIDLPGDPRNHYIARVEWPAEAGGILIQQLNRLQNTNRLYLADPLSGRVRLVFEDRDEAWVETVDEIHWLPGGDRFTWISERDGWRHAYVVSLSTGEARLVTPGEYDVIELLAVDRREECIYFLASPDDPTQKYLYRARLDGSKYERLTPGDLSGTSTYDISPDRRFAVHTYSNFEMPPKIEIVRLPDHDKVREVEDNAQVRKNLEQVAKSPAEFFRVTIEDGVELDAWCLKPPEFDPARKYPLVIYVYGEPVGQTVLDRWGGSGHLWHLLLAQKGYVVMSFENRGTPAPRGRAWRKCVYRRVGILAPSDQAAALREVLRTRPYIDESRVGIWGWSGGGSMSLNAIFKHPDLYHTAIAIAPVSNQRYYDTIYQERYMGLPEDNVEGFWNGSPLHFAHQLKGNLLLIHGTGDDNCHYQGTAALIDELIRHRKSFSMMAYPNRTHSIREGANTTLHLRDLMLGYFLEKLPPGPRS